MITIDGEKIEVKGTIVEMLADVTAIMYSLMEEGYANDKILYHCVDLAKETIDEVKAEREKFRKAFIDKLFE